MRLAPWLLSSMILAAAPLPIAAQSAPDGDLDLPQELTILGPSDPSIRKATKSISNFKLREGMAIGAKATLRGARMYEFLERLIHATLPRIRDFRGVSPKAFDGRGNYTLGLKEQTLFPEIESDKVKRVQGMDITIVTTAKNNADAKELMKLLGIPFANS